MRTKEEILDPYYKQNNNGLDEWVEYSDALKSMEIYAKEVAIAFAKYLDYQGYTLLGSDNDKWASYSDPGKTSEELFNQFINQVK